ncbi:MAG: BNR-4 repeat-containing protein, partial [Desulfobacterales bacterium]|nr:BNR-4 repeat-containing protein [Desulfobacterales bacterium]
MITETMCVHGSDRATAYSPMYKIVRYGNKTHITYLKFKGGSHIVVVRTYNHDTKEWSPEYLNDPVWDNHCSATLAVDSKGYLHIVYGKHGGGGVFKYRESVNPNDASLWDDYIVVGTEGMTYPSMVIDSKDTLHLIYRSAGTYGLYYRKKPSGQPWEAYVALVTGEATYIMSYHCSIIVDGNDVLHVGVHFHHAGTYQGKKAGYMKSTDGGSVWRKSDNTLYTLPVTYATVETLETGLDLRLRNICVDVDNHPMLGVVRWYKSPKDVQFWRHNGTEWVGTILSLAKKDVTGGWIGFWNGITYVFVATLKVGAPWYDPSSEISLFYSMDYGKHFNLKPIEPTDPTLCHWKANVERKNGANTLTEVRVLWMRGVVAGSAIVCFTHNIMPIPEVLVAGISAQATVVVALLLITIVLVAFWKRREIT